MTPAEYDAHVRAWQAKEQRTAQRFSTLAVITNRSLGGKLELQDLLPDANED